MCNGTAQSREQQPATGSETLRIFADFNACSSDFKYWILQYGPDRRPLDDVAKELGLRNEGMPVTLYYEDTEEEFEVSAVLFLEEYDTYERWEAAADMNTFKRIRG